MTTPSQLGRDLHLLVSRLDAAADRMLRESAGTTYARYRVLLAVSELGGGSQRDVAQRLGLSDASLSRSAAALALDGLIAVSAAGGRRRRIVLTPAGESLLQRASALLESRLVALAEWTELDVVRYAEQTRRLSDALARVDDSSEGSR